MKFIFNKHILTICFLTLFHQTIVAQPGSSENQMVKKGLQQQQDNDYSNAIKTYDQLISIAPQNANYWYNRGVVKLQVKNYGDAVVDLNKAIYLDTAIIEAYYNRHLAYKFTSNFQFALADISHYLNAFPNDAESHKSRYALSLQMKEYEYAELDAVWMVKNNIGSDTVKIQLLSIYDAQKKSKDKFNFLNYELTQNPGNSKMHYFRAVCLHEMEKYSQSNTDLDRFLLSEPKNIDALKLKFDNCFFSKDFDLAVKIIEELIDDNPTNGTYLADYGHVLLQTKKWKDAEKKFTHAIKMKTGNLSYVYLGRGIARFNLGKLGLACQDWDRSLLMGEKNAAIYIEKHCK